MCGLTTNRRNFYILTRIGGRRKGTAGIAVGVLRVQGVQGVRGRNLRVCAVESHVEL